MAAIKDLPYTLTSTGIADRTVVWFAVDKTDESPAPGKTMKFSLDELAETIGADVSPYATMEQAAHGLTTNAVGYAMFGHAVYDDVAPDQWATGVFVEYLTVNTFRYAAAGQSFTLPAARINEESYSIATDGRFLFWDSSANGWKKTKPIDTQSSVPPLLMVNSYSQPTSSYNVTFLGFGPLGT